ncbi:MAG: Rieske 2Fe-2S domain-containing protein [Gammaproteobacteria bacterium]|nr:Rieske 2Fe-2S domain-containing protein [Gammaproteobacteria bacterium]
MSATAQSLNDPWIKAGSLRSLKRKGRIVRRIDGKQIALFDTAHGVLACNNRCPHEGYPLREGSLDDRCVLTCNWHNWKFDLTTGGNLYGGDRLRVYPVELRGDEVWLNLADPPVEARQQEIMANLRQAFDDNDYQRMARELGRLCLLGVNPVEALVHAIGWSYNRLEFGWTHAYGGAADWLTLYHEHAGDEESQLICLLEAIAHIADEVLREKTYPYSDRISDYDEDQFVEAIEREDECEAVAQLRGAFAGGLNFQQIERGLTRAALQHYNDFGHSLIYVTKARRLIEHLGEGVAEPLLLSLARSMVYATREDNIPKFRGYRDALNAWRTRSNGVNPHMDMWRGLGIDKALELTVDCSASAHDSLYAAMLGVNAANMLAFSLRQQHKVRVPVSDNVGWLDFTHGITFASAVREQCTRFPQMWPAGLLQLTCFCGRNAAFTEKRADLDGWHVHDADAFFAKTIESLLDHNCDEFIVSVHLLKTVLAAREEVWADLPKEVSDYVLAAVNRFLNSPLKRKQARRTVYQAMKFVARDG